MALLFPNSFATGYANLGFSFVYQTLVEYPDIFPHRYFTPENPLRGKPLTSQETLYPLNSCELLLFSVAYELDYPNLLRLLQAIGFPLDRRQRENRYPLVVVGGIAPTLNPEPLAPFVDLFLLGDGENNLRPFIERWLTSWSNPRRNSDFLEQVAREVPGAYAPHLVEVSYDPRHWVQSCRLLPPQPRPQIQLAQPGKIKPVYAHTLPEEGAFASHFLLEVSRGCPTGCRFCAISYLGRPPRFFEGKRLIAILRQEAQQMEGRTVGLVGAAVSQHPQLKEICQALLQLKSGINISSVSFNALDDELLSLLDQGGVQSLTLALEAGSERLRRAINKPIAAATVRQVASSLAHLDHLRQVKLYLILGLPGETESDVEEAAASVREISALLYERRKQLKISVQPFVPKPLTPFQWAPMAAVRVLKERRKQLEKGLAGLKGLNCSVDSARQAVRQCVYSLGDRRVGELIRRSVDLHDSLTAPADKELIELQSWIPFREKGADEVFPWDFLKHPVGKKWLYEEYRKARAGTAGTSCRPGHCTICGACG